MIIIKTIIIVSDLVITYYAFIMVLMFANHVFVFFIFSAIFSKFALKEADSYPYENISNDSDVKTFTKHAL